MQLKLFCIRSKKQLAMFMFTSDWYLIDITINHVPYKQNQLIFQLCLKIGIKLDEIFEYNIHCYHFSWECLFKLMKYYQ